jgi:hypothetical protein
MGDETACCKRCGIEKVRVYKRIQPSSGNKLYVDDHGRYWKSMVCPACQADIRRTRPKSVTKNVTSTPK